MMMMMTTQRSMGDQGSSLQWRHNGCDGFLNHQSHDCLLNCLFSRRSKKTSKLSVTGLCAGNSPDTSEFPTQMASNAENVSIWWRHHDKLILLWPGEFQSLQWRHNGCDSVSNHQLYNCLLNGLFKCRSKKTSKLRVTGLCAENSPETGEFPAQKASFGENASIWWRHHGCLNMKM